MVGIEVFLTLFFGVAIWFLLLATQALHVISFLPPHVVCP